MATSIEKNKCFFTKPQLRNAVLNPQGSKQFVKKIVPMSVSFILHQRVQFPEKDFQTRTYNEMQYKVFKPKLQNVTLRQIREWVNGALEALDTNYLRELYLILADTDNPDVIFESYKFQFKYMGDDAITVDMPSTEKDLVQSTSLLLEAIESLQVHTKYEEAQLDIKMAVTYYEDVTPEDYSPPGFKNNTDSANVILQSLEKQASHYMILGCLKTGHHTVKCRGKGELFGINHSVSSSNLIDQQLDEFADNNSTEESGDKGLDHESELQSSQRIETQTELQDSQETNFEISTQELEEFDRRNTATPTISEISRNDFITIDDESIQCYCKVFASFEHIGKVTCSQCWNVHHCVCLGYLNADDVPSPYVCELCNAGLTYFTPMKEQKKKLFCAYRLAVAVAYFTESFPQQVITEMATEVKEFVVKRMTAFKILKKQNDGEYIVNMELLRTSYIQGIFTNSFSQKRKSDDVASEQRKKIVNAK